MAVADVAAHSHFAFLAELIAEGEVFGGPVGHDAAEGRCGAGVGAHEVHAVHDARACLAVEAEFLEFAEGAMEVVVELQGVVAVDIAGSVGAYAAGAVIDVAHGDGVVGDVVG